MKIFQTRWFPTSITISLSTICLTAIIVKEMLGGQHVRVVNVVKHLDAIVFSIDDTSGQQYCVYTKEDFKGIHLAMVAYDPKSTGLDDIKASGLTIVGKSNQAMVIVGWGEDEPVPFDKLKKLFLNKNIEYVEPAPPFIQITPMDKK